MTLVLGYYSEARPSRRKRTLPMTGVTVGHLVGFEKPQVGRDGRQSSLSCAAHPN